MTPTSIQMLLAFFEGFILILSPCILPILPLILSGSLSGSKWRPLGVIIGFIIAFTLFTLFSKVFISFLAIDPDTLRYSALLILISLGIIMLSDFLSEKFNSITALMTSWLLKKKNISNHEGGFTGGVSLGVLIGILWTPCAGPILAAVLVQIIVQKTTLASVFIILTFALGVSIPMLFIAYVSRKLSSQFYFFRKKSTLLRKLLGLLIILSTILLYYSNEITLWYSNLNKLNSEHAFSNYSIPAYPAPPITDIDHWINSVPLDLNSLKGKVILIDFWTYSCINCIRTLPYLNKWYQLYQDKGLIIIGIHSPEFIFEKKLSNVIKAVQKYGILYPIALDNNFSTWQNYHNQYWPAHYLINQEGYVVYQSFGEGGYDIMESKIRALLGIKGNIVSASQNYASMNQTPEIYLGYARINNFNGRVRENQETLYNYSQSLPINSWELQGKWVIASDRIIAKEANASIKLHFTAKKVYAVMGMSQNPIFVTVKLNNNVIGQDKGNDVNNNQILVNENRLYSLVNLKQGQEAILELTAKTPGLELYTFTFGN